MTVEIGLLSMTQIQKLSKSQHHHHHHHHQNQPQSPNSNSTTPTISSPSTWMWNPREHKEEDDDSWEDRAFAEDTKNVMVTTWPPRSYTCSFCKREFRSAQALGGHMNVHRRDRARLHHHHHHHQAHPSAAVAANSPNPTSSSHHPTPSFISIPPQELVANGGLCLPYHLPSPNNDNIASFTTHHGHNTTLSACGKSPCSTLVSVSSYPPNNLAVRPTCSPSFDFPVSRAIGINGLSSFCCDSSKMEEPSSSFANRGLHDELDLELRLGHKSPPN